MYNEFKKPIMKIQFDSEDGNIYMILQKAANLLRQSFFTDQSQKINEMKTRIYAAESYEEALDIIGEYVTIEGE